MISGRTIFISPIDWGLGHASRCVPIIKDLAVNNTVMIGTTPLNAFFFEDYFPSLQKLEMPSYNISYSKKLPLWLKLLIQWPKINKVIGEEKKVLKKIVDAYHIDFIISDNRFGLSHDKVHSVFLSHQLKLKTPFFSSIANHINRKYIHKYNEVWVPDFEDVNLRLSGQLSDAGRIKIPVRYIGPQSALSDVPASRNSSVKYDYLVLLSGVEPQRTILENILLKKFEHSDKQIVFVRGANTPIVTKNKNIRLINFTFGEELRELIVNSETVICRSGYSTLMDLHVLGKRKLILIPTPGQSEQEYLGKIWSEKHNAILILQSQIAGYKIK